MDQAGGQREALLPAARQRARELLLALDEAEPLERAVDRFAPPRQLEQARDEVEVLADRQVVVEAELLRHVADLALDRGGLRVMSRPRQVPEPASGVSSPQSMRIVVVLPLPFGPEEAADATRGDLQLHVVDDGATAVALGQPGDVDRQVGHDGLSAARRTSSGWPGRRRGASFASGTASTMKTSLVRWAFE